jgi:hypothetical protein
MVSSSAAVSASRLLLAGSGLCSPDDEPHLDSMTLRRLSGRDLTFEYALLERMLPEYRDTVLADLKLSVREVIEAARRCPIQLPQGLASDIETYRRLLGPEVSTDAFGQSFDGWQTDSTPSCFLCLLWPALFWVVRRNADGGVVGVGFENQISLNFDRFAPAAVRPGLWVQPVLESLADSVELFDGWDERSDLHLTFGDSRYEGIFVFGLLNRWRLIS